MTDISKEAVERLAQVSEAFDGGLRNATTLRAQAARIAELEAQVITARADALREAAIISPIKCEDCAGTGEEDDADCGDISFNTWKCRKCGGTGKLPNPEILSLIDKETTHDTPPLQREA